MASIIEPVTAQAIEQALKTDVRSALSADIVSQVLAAAPFVEVPGVFNMRDLSQPDTATGEAVPPLIRRGLIYRSGMLTFIKDEGKTRIASELGIKTIFDLRHVPERVKQASPVIDGVETRWLEPAREPDGIDIAAFAAEDGGIEAMLNVYRNILVTHVPVYREILEHIRDHPDRPILFHCTGGKDRTGVITALILQIAGYPTHVIARDYTMTRIGVEPARDFFLKELYSAKIRTNPIAERGVVGLCSVHYETMVRFLEYLREKYEGGGMGYMLTELGFSEEDVEKIKINLKG